MIQIDDIITDIKQKYEQFVAKQVAELSDAIVGQDVIILNTYPHAHRRAVVSDVYTWSGNVSIRVKIYKKTNRGVLTADFLALDPLPVHRHNLVFCSDARQYARYLLEYG